MAYLTIRPTRADVLLADSIAAHTEPGTEAVVETLTWGADEHVLCALAAGWWLYCRNKTADARRRSDHILLTTLVASALLLAHWASDVAADLAVGAVTERLLRLVTGYGRSNKPAAGGEAGTRPWHAS